MAAANMVGEGLLDEEVLSDGEVHSEAKQVYPRLEEDSPLLFGAVLCEGIPAIAVKWT